MHKYMPSEGALRYEQVPWSRCGRALGRLARLEQIVQIVQIVRAGGPQAVNPRRYCTASATWSTPMASDPARSAMVRATFSTR